jgi:hypothetical protein
MLHFSCQCQPIHETDNNLIKELGSPWAQQRDRSSEWILKLRTRDKSNCFNTFQLPCTNQIQNISLLLLQSALQPLVGFRPAQPSLSILSRKVLLSAVASGTSNPQLGGEPGILERCNFRHKRSPASQATLANPAAEGGTMGEKWPRILPKVTTSTSMLGSFTCRKARHGTDGFTSPSKEGVLRIFSPEKSDGFGRVWTRELGYKRTARYL